MNLEDKSIEDVLKTVEATYARKDYPGALKILEENQAKLSSGVWHYNMGTVLGKLENYPLARFHFLKAEDEGFHSQEVAANKSLVEERLDVAKYEKPLTTSDYLVRSGMFLSEGLFTTITLLLVLVAVWSIWKKASWKAFGSLMSIALIIFGINLWVHQWDKRIALSPVGVQDGPSAIFQAKGELPSGLVVITEKKGNWLKIIYPSRFEGWVKEGSLKELR